MESLRRKKNVIVKFLFLACKSFLAHGLCFFQTNYSIQFAPFKK